MNSGIVGYRFKPTDEQLISYFLKHKMDGNDFYVDRDIAEIDLCKHEPWDLPDYAALEKPNKDQVWYFFCLRDLKYPRSQRANRTTKAGYWKSTGKDRQIKARRTKDEIGTKKTLVFHEGRLPGGVKTNWVIHEYKAKTILPHQRPFVLCKLKKKGDEKSNTASCNKGEPSQHFPSEFENVTEVPIPQVDPELLPESIVIDNGSDVSHPSTMQQHSYIEQSPSSKNILLINDLSNGSEELIPQFDTVEQEEDAIKLADSFLVDPAVSDCENVTDISAHEYNNEESVDAHINDSKTQKSWSGVSLDDIRDADTEVTHEESFQLLEALNLSAGNASSKEFQQMQTVQALTEKLPSSIHDQNEKEEIGSHSDEILLMEANSVGSDTNKCIYYISSVSEVSDYITTHRPQQQKARKATIPGIAIDLTQTKGSVNLSQKETFIMESDHDEILVMEALSADSDTEKYIYSLELVFDDVLDYITAHVPGLVDKKATMDGPAIDRPQEEISVDLPKTETYEKDLKGNASLKLRTIGLAENNGMCSFIRLETHPLSHTPNRPSVYAAKPLLGLVVR